MPIWDTIGDLLGNAAAKIHIDVLSGNDNSNSPKNINKNKQVEKSRIKIIDKSVHNDNSVHNHLTIIQVSGQLPQGSVPEELAPLVRAYEDKEIAYVASEQQNEISGVLAFEQDPHIVSVLKFFNGKLTGRDYALLRTGLYLKYLRKNNPEEARKQWELIKSNNTNRDRRVINLAGADYFNTYFRPLYKELDKESDSLSNFRKQFENIIDDMHFVVFVGSDMSVSEIVNDVNEKTLKNIRYGVKDEIIYIHAAGGSVGTVEKAIPELRSIFPDMAVKRNLKSGKNLIKVSIRYRINKLDK